MTWLILISLRLGNGMLPDGTMPLPNPMLTSCNTYTFKEIDTFHIAFLKMALILFRSQCVDTLMWFFNLFHFLTLIRHRMSKAIPQDLIMGSLETNLEMFSQDLNYELINGLFWGASQGISRLMEYWHEIFHIFFLPPIELLAHWPQGDVVVILNMLSPNRCYRLSSWSLLVNSPSRECHRTPMMIS